MTLGAGGSSRPRGDRASTGRTRNRIGEILSPAPGRGWQDARLYSPGKCPTSGRERRRRAGGSGRKDSAPNLLRQPPNQTGGRSSPAPMRPDHHRLLRDDDLSASRPTLMPMPLSRSADNSTAKRRARVPPPVFGTTRGRSQVKSDNFKLSNDNSISRGRRRPTPRPGDPSAGGSEGSDPPRAGNKMAAGP